MIYIYPKNLLYIALFPATSEIFIIYTNVPGFWPNEGIRESQKLRGLFTQNGAYQLCWTSPLRNSCLLIQVSFTFRFIQQFLSCFCWLLKVPIYWWIVRKYTVSLNPVSPSCRLKKKKFSREISMSNSCTLWKLLYLGERTLQIWLR